MCTNGLLFPRSMEDLLRIGRNLNLLVSLDGLGEDHEELRGRGTFAPHDAQHRDDAGPQAPRRVRRRDCPCRAWSRTSRSTACTSSWSGPRNWASTRSTSSSPGTSAPKSPTAMDDVYQESLLLASARHRHRPADLALLHLPAAARAAARAARVHGPAGRPGLGAPRAVPAATGGRRGRVLHPGDLRARSAAHPCLAVSNRMEVHADGNVSSCKFFPEFVVGNLYETGTVDLWRASVPPRPVVLAGPA